MEEGLVAGIFYGFSGPNQQVLDPRNIIVLGVAPATTPISSEFRWKESGAANWSPTVAGTTETQYSLPANTWPRDKIMVWQGRYQDSGGWSEWRTFVIDTYAWDGIAFETNAKKVTLGQLTNPAIPGNYEARLMVRDGAGLAYSNFSLANFVVQKSRTLVKDSGGRWKGVPETHKTGSGWTSP